MSSNRWNNPVNSNLLRDAQGNLLPSGSIAIYAAGTSTPLAVYSDINQSISLGSVLNCDAYGLIPDFHVAENTQFKVVAYDAQDGPSGTGAVKWTRDYIYTSDKSLDARLDAVEATVNALTSNSYNGIVNGGMRVALGSAATLSASFQVGTVNRLYGRVTNVTAGTLTQGSDTSYASAKYGHFSNVSTSSSGVVEAQIRVPAGEAGRFVDDACVFSCLVRQDTGSAINYTITVKTPTTTANDFSSLTTISTGVATSVATGTDTRLALAVAGMGDCSKGIAIEVSAAVGTITTKNFRITEAQFEVGSVRTSFVQGDYDMALGSLKATEGIIASDNLFAATTSAKGAVEQATDAEVKARTASKFPDSAQIKFDPGVAKAMAKVTGRGTNGTCTISANTNVTSVDRSAAGNYVITIASDMSSADYVILVTTKHSAAARFYRITSQNPGDFTVLFENSAASNDDPDGFFFAVFGELA